jgi:hypothetical protein
MSHGYVWVSPVFKTPYPHAPDTRNSGYYVMDAYGRWTGPHYYLVPPFRPGGGMLPGPIGQAIMAGNLPHTLMQNKDQFSLGNAPMLGKHGPQQQSGPPPQQQYHATGPSPMLGSSAMQNYGMMQVPNMAMATPQYAMPYQQPYPQTHAPMGYGPKPMMWAPYPGQAQPPMQYAPPTQYAPPAQQPGPHAVYWKGSNGIWQVQNAPAPGSPAPFATIPGFQPGQPPLNPMPTPGQPPLTPMPGMNPGFGPMQQFNPMQQFQPMQPFDPLSRMQPPNPQFDQMQMPRMDAMPPPVVQQPGTAYPVHPFTRSPRDFFMWGEVMEQQRARGNRPLPVP